MPAYKDGNTGTWRSQFYYTDWTGKKHKKNKRGFKTKKEAQQYEAEFVKSVRADMSMTLAKLLGAEEKDGSFLYRHAGNSIGSSRAYFSWRFLVDSKEYLVYVLDIDSREYWTVGIADYETTE